MQIEYLKRYKFLLQIVSNMPLTRAGPFALEDRVCIYLSQQYNSLSKLDTFLKKNQVPHHLKVKCKESFKKYQRPLDFLNDFISTEDPIKEAVAKHKKELEAAIAEEEAYEDYLKTPILNLEEVKGLSKKKRKKLRKKIQAQKLLEDEIMDSLAWRRPKTEPYPVINSYERKLAKQMKALELSTMPQTMFKTQF